MKRFVLTSSLFALSVLYVACTAASTPTPSGTVTQTACGEVSFQTQVQPIIETKCVSCHGTGNREGDFTSYAGIKSALSEVRLHALVIKNMPPRTAPQLTTEESDTLKCWIDSGAENN